MTSLIAEADEIYAIDLRPFEGRTSKRTTRRMDFENRRAAGVVRKDELKAKSNLSDNRYDMSRVYYDDSKFDKSGYEIPSPDIKLKELDRIHAAAPYKFLKKIEGLLKTAKKEYMNLLKELDTFNDSSELETLLSRSSRNLSKALEEYRMCMRVVDENYGRYKNKEITKEQLKDNLEDYFVSGYGKSAPARLSELLYDLIREMKELKPYSLEQLDESELSIVLEKLKSIED